MRLLRILTALDICGLGHMALSPGEPHYRPLLWRDWRGPLWNLGRWELCLRIPGMYHVSFPTRHRPQQALHLRVPEPGRPLDPPGPGMAGADPPTRPSASAQVLPALAAQQGTQPQGPGSPRDGWAPQTSEDPHLCVRSPGASGALPTSPTLVCLPDFLFCVLSHSLPSQGWSQELSREQRRRVAQASHCKEMWDRMKDRCVWSETCIVVPKLLPQT